MSQTGNSTRSTRASTFVDAPREVVYQAFLDPEAVASWLPPDGMTGRVQTFDPRPGGVFRVSLTYRNPEDSLGGKTTADTDTVEGRFAEMVPNDKIVWVTAFDSDDPQFAGDMHITWSFADAGGRTEVTVLFTGIPPGIRLEDNELGSQQTLRKLARFIEHDSGDRMAT